MTSNVRQRATYAPVNRSEDPIDIRYVRADEKPPSSLQVYLHTFFWVGLAALTWWYSSLFRVLCEDSRIRQWALYTVIFLSCLIAVIFAYLTVVGRGRKVDFLKEYPVLIHVATLSGVASFIIFIIAIWPVWRWVSIPMTIITTIAVLLSPNLIADIF